MFSPFSLRIALAILYEGFYINYKVKFNKDAIINQQKRLNKLAFYKVIQKHA